MSPKSAFDEEMSRRREHLEGLPAWELREDLDALQRSFGVFNRNASELAMHVGKFLKSSMNAQQLPEEYVEELVQRTHNYLTSVTSLIDSQRVVMRHRWPVQRGSSENCESCGRPLPTNENRSDFEANDYADRLAATFETGEGVFMTKLRNYCTHYSIPLPTLGTTLTMQAGRPAARLVNTLQLGRDKLLRWNGWGGAAKAYLLSQPEYFDLVPIIERYVNSAGQFAQWFWGAINDHSASLIDEITSKAAELDLWRDECVGFPDWFQQGLKQPPSNWNGRLWKARKRAQRYQHGTRGFRVWSVGDVVTLVKDDDWAPLHLRYY